MLAILTKATNSSLLWIGCEKKLRQTKIFILLVQISHQNQTKPISRTPI
jgi:hypothetical protein